MWGALQFLLSIELLRNNAIVYNKYSLKSLVMDACYNLVLFENIFILNANNNCIILYDQLQIFAND